MRATCLATLATSSVPAEEEVKAAASRSDSAVATAAAAPPAPEADCEDLVALDGGGAMGACREGKPAAEGKEPRALRPKPSRPKMSVPVLSPLEERATREGCDPMTNCEPGMDAGGSSVREDMPSVGAKPTEPAEEARERTDRSEPTRERGVTARRC
jgi:hypothetical protein